MSELCRPVNRDVNKRAFQRFVTPMHNDVVGGAFCNVSIRVAKPKTLTCVTDGLNGILGGGGSFIFVVERVS